MVVLFYIFAALAVIAALSVVAQRTPIFSALSLIVVLCSLAVVYLLLGAEFIAVTGAVVFGGFTAESVAFATSVIGLAAWSAAVAVPERTQFVPTTIVVVNPVPTGSPVNRQLAMGCTPPVVGTLIE